MTLKSDNGRQRNKVNSVGGYCTYEAAVSSQILSTSSGRFSY